VGWFDRVRVRCKDSLEMRGPGFLGYLIWERELVPEIFDRIPEFARVIGFL